MASSPNWQSFSVQIPAQDLAEKSRETLETLMVFLETLKAILDTVSTFLVDFGNPIKPLVEALIQLILGIFETLKQTGIYAWYDTPDLRTDPNLSRAIGGYSAFVTRLKASLADPRDPNRPQPVAGLDKGGFLIIAIDAGTATALLKAAKILLRFFGREFITPQYLAPANVKVLPAGDQGDPILSVVRVFQQQPKSLVVEWALPPSSRPGDPGFSDIVQSFTSELVPPKFLIEKSSSNPHTEIDVGKLKDAQAAGRVTALVPTKFEERGQPGKVISTKVQLTDEYGDPFTKFQKYIVVDATHSTASFLLGQLGTFRYIDSDVEVGKTYYYRVRAFSGSLAVDSNGTLQFAQEQPQFNVLDQQPGIQWPASNPDDEPVMGKASPVMCTRLPSIPAKFDVIENLKRLFQVAFSLNFHLPLPAGKTFDAGGMPKGDATMVTDIGKGSLTDLAGSLLSFQASPLSGSGRDFQYGPDPVTGKLPEMPWQTSLVRANATRLASMVSSALLAGGSAEAFRALMQGPLPKGSPSSISNSTTLEKLVFAITDVQKPASVSMATARDAAIQYGKVFVDPKVRLNVLSGVTFTKSFTLGGTPPDWLQVSILRDIVPWSGQYLYELLAKIQALFDAYKGVAEEIKTFTGLIERKITILEEFLQYLLSILNFVDGLSLGGLYILNVPEVDGDVSAWMAAIDSAGGDKPSSGPGGYMSGVALAYVGPNVKPFVDAFKLLF